VRSGQYYKMDTHSDLIGQLLFPLIKDALTYRSLCLVSKTINIIIKRYITGIDVITRATAISLPEDFYLEHENLLSITCCNWNAVSSPSITDNASSSITDSAYINNPMKISLKMSRYTPDIIVSHKNITDCFDMQHKILFREETFVNIVGGYVPLEIMLHFYNALSNVELGGNLNFRIVLPCTPSSSEKKGRELLANGLLSNRLPTNELLSNRLPTNELPANRLLMDELPTNVFSLVHGTLLVPDIKNLRYAVVCYPPIMSPPRVDSIRQSGIPMAITYNPSEPSKQLIDVSITDERYLYALYSNLSLIGRHVREMQVDFLEFIAYAPASKSDVEEAMSKFLGVEILHVDGNKDMYEKQRYSMFEDQGPLMKTYLPNVKMIDIHTHQGEILSPYEQSKILRYNWSPFMVIHNSLCFETDDKFRDSLKGWYHAIMSRCTPMREGINGNITIFDGTSMFRFDDADHIMYISYSRSYGYIFMIVNSRYINYNNGDGQGVNFLESRLYECVGKEGTLTDEGIERISVYGDDYEDGDNYGDAGMWGETNDEDYMSEDVEEGYIDLPVENFIHSIDIECIDNYLIEAKILEKARSKNKLLSLSLSECLHLSLFNDITDLLLGD